MPIFKELTAVIRYVGELVRQREFGEHRRALRAHYSRRPSGRPIATGNTAR
jgi:hypothetical protein